MLDFSKISVMVIENSLPMMKLSHSILETLGVGRVHRAMNAEEAFETFCKTRPDIVITEWSLEPFDGIKLVQMLRKDVSSPNKLAPVIMTTGYSAVKRVITARDAGVTEFLVKPFSAKDLAKRVAYVINRPRDFVDSPEYFGPDRRRIVSPDYNGAKRRQDDLNEGKTAFL